MTSASASPSSSASAAVTASSAAVTKPPVAERDEDRVVYAGAAPPGWDPELPRQSDESIEPLMDPPVAIPDPYGWMRDEKRTSERVLSHLKAENDYTQHQTAHLKDLRDTLYQEMLGSIQETDYTTPRPHGPHAYYTRTYQGKAYTVYCRAPIESLLKASNHNWDGSIESPVLENEVVLLDVNELAKDKPYCDVAMKVSPSHQLLAYAADFSGNEMCGLYVQSVETGHIVDHDPELVVYGSVRWGSDDTTLFYLKMDSTQRPYQLWKRTIGSTEPDVMLFEEPNELYWMGIHKSLDGKFLFMEVSSKETSEIWYLDLTEQEGSSPGTLKCVAPRRDKVLYEVEHRHGKWWIASNVGGLPNFAVFTSPAVSDSASKWTLVTDSSSATLFDGGYDQSVDAVTCFEDHVVVTGRQGGLPRVWVLGGIGGAEEDGESPTNVASMERLSFEEDAYDVIMESHYEFNTNKVAVTYDSMITPPQSLEIDMNDTTQRAVLKSKNVPGYDRTLFDCRRTFVKSRDGHTEIPVSMVYRKDVMEKHLKTKEPVHVHLYGYGSYGSCVEADWRGTRLPLLNRGMVYVQAHVRGGGEMGRQWYEEPNGAKYLCKKNTFHDFVDVASWLVHDQQLTKPDLLSCEGRSAGGMLIGATINEAPHLFRAAILGVPFVDVVCTMIGTQRNVRGRSGL
jgi:oligopeptidase B